MLLINRGIFWSKEELHTVDFALPRFNAKLWNFSTDYFVKIYYKMFIFFYYGFCAKKWSTKNVFISNASQKLLYRKFTSVTSMHEKKQKKQDPYKKGKM